MAKSQPLLKIGHYEIGKTIGEGTFGKVKIGTHDKTGHQVAIKILNKNKINTHKMTAKVVREIQIMKMFIHPHVTRLLEVIQANTDIFMIMEYIPGGELFDYITKNEISEIQARKFFQQLISGVHYCHQRRVVHRDLKPENLLLNENLELKIADFGLSKIMEDGEFLATSCGSPYYASPEVVSGTIYVGPEIDVWSCGVILFALLTKKLPFNDKRTSILFQKIRKAEYIIPPFVSSSAADLISKMLNPDPIKRITISQIMEHSWFSEEIPNYILEWKSYGEILTRIEKPDPEILKLLCIYLNSNEKTALKLLKSGQNQEYILFYKLIYEKKLEEKKNENNDNKNKNENENETKSNQEEFNLKDIYSIPTILKKNQRESQSKRGVIHDKQWNLGVVLRESPEKIMSEVYRVMKLCKLEWFIENDFRLRCRISKTENDFQNSNKQIPDIEIQICLFSLVKNEKKFVLDFRKIRGEIFWFFHVCSFMINSLEIEKFLQ
ncbi:non-specific serine/threonine protein kinase [Anaeramoeba ignava]|uniref:non-specific serine/threonine protein kinase n=1 Tax=Anaeramoeba ignava TaxID=1746090 RepID=A0A9Q0LS41_ANAIG|nr:non-specific serine/threonine protein kinase [Anaeramoeba ignava]